VCIVSIIRAKALRGMGGLSFGAAAEPETV
jgi:hypothetical protein